MIILRFLFLAIILSYVESYKILVYNPKFGTSHVTMMGKLADILAKAGHDVLVYLPEYIPEVTTNGTIFARTLVRPRDFEATLTMTSMQGDVWSGNNEGVAAMIKMFGKMRQLFLDACRNQIHDQAIISQLKSENFDLAIGEPIDACYYGLIQKLGIKNHISVGSTTLWEYASMALGIPGTTSFVPSSMSNLRPPFTYFERVQNLIGYFTMGPAAPHMFAANTIEFLNKELEGGFDYSDMIGKSSIYLANVDEHVDFPRPITHKVVYIGGIGKVQAKPLPKHLNDVFDNSNKGVVYVSFGSVAQSYLMPSDLKNMFLQTFTNFPDVTFLWKYEKDDDNVTQGYPNVVTEKWLPQNDLLEHPKLLAFVTHAGMNSAQEGSSKGVPMICIPFFADQFRNSKMLEHRNMAVVVDRNELSVEVLTKAIREIIEDDKYRKNAKRIADMITHKPMSAEERVVKYVEFAAKFGPDLNLDMQGRHLNFVEFYCLDIILPFLIVSFVVLYGVYRFVKFVLRQILNFVIVSKKKVD